MKPGRLRSWNMEVWCREDADLVILFLVNFHLIPQLFPSLEESRVKEKLAQGEREQGSVLPPFTGSLCGVRCLPEAHSVKRPSAKLAPPGKGPLSITSSQPSTRPWGPFGATGFPRFFTHYLFSGRNASSS